MDRVRVRVRDMDTVWVVNRVRVTDRVRVGAVHSHESPGSQGLLSYEWFTCLVVHVDYTVLTVVVVVVVGP